VRPRSIHCYKASWRWRTRRLGLNGNTGSSSPSNVSCCDHTHRPYGGNWGNPYRHYPRYGCHGYPTGQYKRTRSPRHVGRQHQGRLPLVISVLAVVRGLLEGDVTRLAVSDDGSNDVQGRRDIGLLCNHRTRIVGTFTKLHVRQHVYTKQDIKCNMHLMFIL